MQAQVTNLTPPLIEKLRAAFGEEYPQVRPMPIGILIFHEEQRRSILIGPEQSVVANEGMPVQVEFNRHLTAFKKLQEIFEWKEPVRFGFNLIGFMPVGDAKNTSLSEFLSISAGVVAERLPEAVGAGVRLVVDFDDLRGDLKVEPFEPDNRFLAVHAEIGCKEAKPLDDLVETGIRFKNRFLERWVPFVEASFTDV